MNLDWLLGFIEGEGCFTHSSGKYIQPLFIIGIHSRDKEALVKIKDFVGIGYVIESKKGNMSYYQVHSKSGCMKIIKLLENKQFILPSRKERFERWKKIVLDNPSIFTRDNNIREKVINVLKKHPEGIWINELARESKVNISSLYYNLKKKMAQEVEVFEIKKASTKKGKPVMVYYKLKL